MKNLKLIRKLIAEVLNCNIEEIDDIALTNRAQWITENVGADGNSYLWYEDNDDVNAVIDMNGNIVFDTDANTDDIASFFNSAPLDSAPEIRKLKLMCHKDGHGNSTYRLSVPTSWVNQLNRPKKLIVELNNNSISIVPDNDMLLIKHKGTKNSLGHYIDYVLEDDTELYDSNWNGEIYTNGSKEGKDTNKTYKPVYRFEALNVDINNIEENSNEWHHLTEIIGFKEL